MNNQKFNYYKPILSVGYSTEGEAISAFDDALFEGGIGNYNLVKVSSILPPNVIENDTIKLPVGNPLYIAYTSVIVSSYEVASVGIAIVRPTSTEYGLIIEISDGIDEESMKDRLYRATKERCRYRQITNRLSTAQYFIISSEKIVNEFTFPTIACLFAGVALF